MAYDDYTTRSLTETLGVGDKVDAKVTFMTACLWQPRKLRFFCLIRGPLHDLVGILRFRRPTGFARLRQIDSRSPPIGLIWTGSDTWVCKTARVIPGK